LAVFNSTWHVFTSSNVLSPPTTSLVILTVLLSLWDEIELGADVLILQVSNSYLLQRAQGSLIFLILRRTVIAVG